MTGLEQSFAKLDVATEKNAAVLVPRPVEMERDLRPHDGSDDGRGLLSGWR